jgi:hypothetical protein
MTILNFTVSVEIQNEKNLSDTQIDQTLSALEDLLIRHPAGYDLYDSGWYYED